MNPKVLYLKLVSTFAVIVLLCRYFYYDRRCINNLVLIIISGSSIMKRNFKVSKIFFRYHYKPITIYSFVYKPNFAKVPSEPANLKKPLQRYKPYSVNREVEGVKLGEVTTPVAGSGSTLSKSLPQVSLGLQKQSGKEMSIDLTEQESEICNILRKVTAYLKETKNLPLIELRIAGGWVRDKVMFVFICFIKKKNLNLI